MLTLFTQAGRRAGGTEGGVQHSRLERTLLRRGGARSIPRFRQSRNCFKYPVIQIFPVTRLQRFSFD